MVASFPRHRAGAEGRADHHFRQRHADAQLLFRLGPDRRDLQAFAGDFHEPVNIGNPLELTIKEFGERIVRLVGSKSTLVYHPLPTDDPKQRRPDITRARQRLGWEPKVELEDGLKQTIEYFKSRV